ncbi:MAG: DUF502 domain-containing protein [Balneolaceae bacterium]
MKPFINYFLRGLLFVFPLFATLYVVILLVNWVNDSLNSILFNWLPINIPGLGIITAFFLIILLGFGITRAFAKPLFSYLERLLEKTPFIKIIYTAFKDFTEAFFGEKKRFNKPVIVNLVDGVDRIGFITETDLRVLQVQNRIAVYCPHSYNFSGNLFLVEPSRVKPLDIDPADAMKFAVSAGVTHISYKSKIPVAK